MNEKEQKEQKEQKVADILLEKLQVAHGDDILILTQAYAILVQIGLNRKLTENK